MCCVYAVSRSNVNFLYKHSVYGAIQEEERWVDETNKNYGNCIKYMWLSGYIINKRFEFVENLLRMNKEGQKNCTSWWKKQKNMTMNKIWKPGRGFDCWWIKKNCRKVGRKNKSVWDSSFLVLVLLIIIPHFLLVSTFFVLHYFHIFYKYCNHRGALMNQWSLQLYCRTLFVRQIL